MRWKLVSLLLAGTAALGTASGVEAQQIDRSGPTFTLLAGVATGEGSYDLGVSIAGTFRWKLIGNALALRADPWFARYGAGDLDASVTILGGSANLEYVFQSETSSAEPYVFVGPGIFFSNYSGALGSPGGDESVTDLGFGLGGGVRLGSRFLVEARFYEINSFSTVPLMIGYRF